MKLQNFILIFIYLASQLHCLASEDTSMIAFYTRGYGEAVDGLRHELRVPADPRTRGDSISVVVSLTNDGSYTRALPDTIELSLSRFGWSKKTIQRVHWLPSAKDNEHVHYLATCNLTEVLDVAGVYHVGSTLSGENASPLFSKGEQIIIASPLTIPEEIYPLLPDEAKAVNALSPVIRDHSDEDSTANSSVLVTSQVSRTASEIHPELLKSPTQLIATVTMTLRNSDRPKITLRPYLSAILARNGWKKTMSIPLYNLDEIAVTKDEPFEYRFDLRESLDVDVAGDYKIQFGHISKVSIGDYLVETLLTEPCNITVE